jgi:hypothetical protein
MMSVAANSMTSVTCRADAPSTYSSFTPSIVVLVAAGTSRPISPTWRHLAVTITNRVIDLAVRLVVEDGLPYRIASWHLWRDHRVFVPYATIQNWVEAAGKKGRLAG